VPSRAAARIQLVESFIPAGPAMAGGIFIFAGAAMRFERTPSDTKFAYPVLHTAVFLRCEDSRRCGGKSEPALKTPLRQ
jgi:hypothetical protein